MQQPTSRGSAPALGARRALALTAMLGIVSRLRRRKHDAPNRLRPDASSIDLPLAIDAGPATDVGPEVPSAGVDDCVLQKLPRASAREVVRCRR